MHVLVIEDEPTSLKLAHVILAAAGHEVADAGKAEEALELLKQDKPELILLDLALPGMDGLELARRIKSDPSTRDIVIIAITGYPDRFSRQEALSAGCDAYLVKPIDTNALPGVVARAAEHTPGDTP